MIKRMDTAKRRQAVLMLVALALLTFVMIRQSIISVFDGVAIDFSHPQSLEALQQRLDNLMKTAAMRDAVANTYVSIGAEYAERMASLHVLVPTSGNGRTLIAQRLREILENYGQEDGMTITVSTVVPVAEGVSKALVDLTFQAQTDRMALEAVADLGAPARGTAWERVTVEADKEVRAVKVSGRLVVLAVEAAE